MEKRIILLVIFLLFPCFIMPLYAEEPQDVSIIQLIANPADYNGLFIRVKGYVEIEFEGHAVYLSSRDAEYLLTKNGLWLDIPGFEGYKEYDDEYCLIEGTFNATNKGHMRLWSGSIENIKRFELAYTGD